jgi:hypothetical protein
MALGDILVIYDDASTEFGYKFLEKWATVVHREPHAIGIEAQRRNHFRAFWASGLPYCYLTDSDALHDPAWRKEALRLQALAGGAPVCLYNTMAHVTIQGNTIEDDPDSDIIWRRVAPGISYLLTREHVKSIMPFVDNLAHWDWQVPEILGHRFAVARRSYVDHIGQGGLHHDPKQGYDGGDRALNPSVPLVRLRREIVARLKEVYATRDNFTEHASR